jgi:hypothetical protein
MEKIVYFIESNDYSLTPEQWLDLREHFPKTYNDTMKDMIRYHDEENHSKLLKEQGYMYKTTKGLEILDDDVSFKKIIDVFGNNENFWGDDEWKSYIEQDEVHMHFKIH